MDDKCEICGEPALPGDTLCEWHRGEAFVDNPETRSTTRIPRWLLEPLEGPLFGEEDKTDDVD